MTTPPCRLLSEEGIVALLIFEPGVRKPVPQFILILLGDQGFHIGNKIKQFCTRRVNGDTSQRLFDTDIDNFLDTVLLHAHVGIYQAISPGLRNCAIKFSTSDEK